MESSGGGRPTAKRGKSAPALAGLGALVRSSGGRPAILYKTSESWLQPPLINSWRICMYNTVIMYSPYFESFSRLLMGRARTQGSPRHTINFKP